MTTSIQEVHLDKQIRLLDSPGVIYDKSQGGLQGVMNAEGLVDPIGKVESILKRVDAENVKLLYKLEVLEDAQSFLQHVAQKKGRLKKGGIPDTEAAARIVIQVKLALPLEVRNLTVRCASGLEQWQDPFLCDSS